MALHTRASASDIAEVMPDDGGGSCQIWRIDDFKKYPVPELLYGQFFSGESYIVLYKYFQRNKDNFIIYYFQGRGTRGRISAGCCILSRVATCSNRS